MFFRYDRRANYLEVDDDFAHLRGIKRNGDLDFELYYKVKASDAISRGAIIVEVTVFEKTIKRKQILEGSHVGHVDPKRMIKNMLTQVTDAKNAAKQQEEQNVAFRRSDISAWINNDALPALRAKIPTANIQAFKRSSLTLVQPGELKQAADVVPILGTVQLGEDVQNVSLFHSASIDENPTRLMLEMITKDGLDPSFIMTMTHKSIPSSDARAGTLGPSRAVKPSFSSASRLLNHHLFPAGSIVRPMNSNDLDDSDDIQVLRTVTSDMLDVPVNIRIPRRRTLMSFRASPSNYFVRFELINGSTGVAIDTVTRQLDTAQHVMLFNTPRKAPIVKVTKSEISTRANLEIKQLDPGATQVRIYKKGVYTSIVDPEDYILIGSYDVTDEQQSLLVQVEVPRNSCVIYRVVPVGPQGTTGFEYTNVVVRPKKFEPIKSISLTAKMIDTGVRLEARKIPQKVVAIEFLRRNSSLHEAEYTTIDSGMILIDEQTRVSDYVSFVDTTVTPDHVYEYVVKLVYESGAVHQAGDSIVDFMQPAPGKVDTRIDKLVVDQVGTLNVTFVMTTKVLDTSIDIVKNLLQRQDMYDLFQNDVLKEREFLKELIAHNVQRVDLNTGRREDFGILTDSVFSDSDLRKNLAISPLKKGHKYRYEVMPLLRSPETMFESLTKTAVDDITKKSYTFKPAKYHHPITLKKGTLVSSRGLKSHYAKQSMSHGALGVVQTADVSFDVPRSSAIDASASKFDRYTNIVTWGVEGQPEQIDHFVIMKETHGVRTVIGKAHCEFSQGSCQFIHVLTKRDVGVFKYVIVPIFNDYKTGTATKTNTIVVETPSFNNTRRRAATLL